MLGGCSTPPEQSLPLCRRPRLLSPLDPYFHKRLGMATAPLVS